MIQNRVYWSNIHLTRAGFLDNSQRGWVKITPEGLKVLSSGVRRVDLKFLNEVPAYAAWKDSYTKNSREKALENVEREVEEISNSQTPQEQLEVSFRRLKDELAFEVLETVKKIPPSSFENLVVDLLLKMGYGGSRKEAGRTIGKSGDGGIDGVIDEDKLGLDVIYIQAKRYQNPVAISEIRDFAGALLAKRTNKGIFISTSTFPQSAYAFVKSTGQRIVLIDGKQLAELMIENNVGVSVRSVYELKRVDSDYFEEI